jgi:hypothetical protein
MEIVVCSVFKEKSEACISIFLSYFCMCYCMLMSSGLDGQI